jgi:hypothetical protein
LSRLSECGPHFWVYQIAFESAKTVKSGGGAKPKMQEAAAPAGGDKAQAGKQQGVATMFAKSSAAAKDKPAVSKAGAKTAAKPAAKGQSGLSSFFQTKTAVCPSPKQRPLTSL